MLNKISNYFKTIFNGPTSMEWTPKPLEYLNKTARCPDCNAPDFYMGPEGGMAVNIKCACCGHKFWFAPPFTPERIDNADECYTYRPPVTLWDEVYGKNKYTGI